MRSCSLCGPVSVSDRTGFLLRAIFSHSQARRQPSAAKTLLSLPDTLPAGDSDRAHPERQRQLHRALSCPCPGLNPTPGAGQEENPTVLCPPPSAPELPQDCARVPPSPKKHSKMQKLIHGRTTNKSFSSVSIELGSGRGGRPRWNKRPKCVFSFLCCGKNSSECQSFPLQLAAPGAS